MNYQKVLKDAVTILAEVQAIAPVIEAVKVTGTSQIFVCSKELTQDEIDALASYNTYTLGVIK